MNKSTWFIWLFTTTLGALSLFFIAGYNLQEWDESRNGINAYEMVYNGDYLNLYFNGKPDTWNAKPPFFIWSIVLSYNIFGFNEFALRFPSVISLLIIFVFIFKTVNLFSSFRLATITLFVLISCKSLFATHVGLTGDFDAMLVMFLTISAYYFLRYVQLNHSSSLIYSSFFFGIAFLVKGPAALTVLPGFILFLIIKCEISRLVRDKYFYFSLSTFLIIAGLWITSMLMFGANFQNGIYSTSNNLETLFIEDTWNRLTNNDFGTVKEKDFLWVFHLLDTRFNVWNYILFGGLVLLLFKIYKHGCSLFNHLNSKENLYLLFSICVSVPLLFVLNFSANKHSWYAAPVFSYIAFIIAFIIDLLIKQNKIFVYIFSAITVFLFIRHIDYLYKRPADLNLAFSQAKELEIANVYYSEDLPQSIQLYLLWKGCRLIKIKEDIKNSGSLIASKVEIPNTIKLFQAGDIHFLKVVEGREGK